MNLKKIYPLALGLFAIGAVSCNNSTEESNNQQVKEDSHTETTRYVAKLQALNATISGGETHGEAHFIISNDTLQVTIDVQNAPAGIEHWQHFHGFEDGKDAAIATMDQDANGDGIVDIVETGTVSGTTMVPFNELPAAMDLGSPTYPMADEHGNYHYEVRIPLIQLKEAFGKAFGGESIDLDKRVLYIHGVPSATDLPSTVATVHDIPATITLPIAVGKIVKE